MCRIFSRPIFRSLGTEDSRHRRVASAEILLRRLLALDYVLEHPGLPSLPTEPEKVRAFEALGIERRHLPLRVYRGAVGEARHHFRLKLPIALEPDRAVLVYADPGYETATALRSWWSAHGSLCRALRERDRTVEVVVVAREHRSLERPQRVLGHWADDFDLAAREDAPLAGKEFARTGRQSRAGSRRVPRSQLPCPHPHLVLRRPHRRCFYSLAFSTCPSVGSGSSLREEPVTGAPFPRGRPPPIIRRRRS